MLHAHDFTLKDQVRTVYYDGEAVFGLMKLYSLTGEKKWLDSAKKAVDYLILQHYEEHGDHWISYAMDQLIQIDASDDYLTFALANGQQNLEAIYRRRALDPAGMENLMCVRSIVDTVKKKNPLLPALQQWDETFLEQAITYRASYMQESFFYPEIAIYMAAPREVMGVSLYGKTGTAYELTTFSTPSAAIFCIWNTSPNPVRPLRKPPLPCG